jgi:carbon storage regulator
MLVLARNIGEEIIIGRDIRVCVVSVDGGKVRLGVEAPQSIPVDRKEVFLRRLQFTGPASQPVKGAARNG